MKEWFQSNGWLIKGSRETLEQVIMLTVFICLAVLINLACVKLEIPPQAGVITMFVGLLWIFNIQLARHKENLERKYKED